MNKSTTLNPGDKGYAEAIAKTPVEGKGGTLNRVRTFADAQREADEAAHAEVLKADRKTPASTKKEGN